MNIFEKAANYLTSRPLTAWANTITIIGGLMVLIPSIFKSHLPPQTINLWIDASNLLISTYFLYIVNIAHNKMNGDETKDLFDTLSVDDQNRDTLLTRTYLIIRQFRTFISLYLITCILFYVIQIAKNYNELNADAFLEKISKVFSVNEIPAKISIRDFLLYVFLDFGENIFNLVSAMGIIFAFVCLYFKTLDDQNNSIIRYYIIWLVPLLFIVFYITVLLLPGNTSSLSFRFNLIRFIPGLLNGIGMVLLFGRIHAIEYFFKFHLEESKVNSLFILSILVFLPIYAIVQPIYALFNSFKEFSGELIQAITLTFCFLGKVSFLIAILKILQNKFIDKYLITVLLTQNRFFRQK